MQEFRGGRLRGSCYGGGGGGGAAAAAAAATVVVPAFQLT